MSDTVKIEYNSKKRKRTNWTTESFIEKMKDINPNIEILGEYINSNTKISCKCLIDQYPWKPTPSTLLNGMGCPKCAGNNKRTHEEFVQELKNINDNIEVLGRYKNVDSKIWVKCKIDEHKWYVVANSLLRGSGCPVCDGKVVKRGVNDIATLRPDLVKYFVNIEDAYNSCVNSGKKYDMCCPDCGYKKKMQNSKLSKRGFFCQVCSDGVSYPNKFSRAFLRQLPIENFIPEYSPKWANGKKYDNYFEYQDNKYILEMDGEFHYKDNTLNGKSLKESQEIDKYKDFLAKQNNILLIRIDCRESNKDYIKRNILSSKLVNIFDLSLIDWNKCDKYATSNIVKEACDLYNAGIQNTLEISKRLNIERSLVVRYLNKGCSLGFCDYHGDETCKIMDEPMIAKNKLGETVVIAKNVYDMVNQLKEIFPNISFNRDLIRNVCKGKFQTHRKLVFEYIS